MAHKFMVYSDQLILPTLQLLASERIPATATLIAERSGVPYGTVKRRINTLVRAGVIRRRRIGRRWGSYYEIVEHERTA